MNEVRRKKITETYRDFNVTAHIIKSITEIWGKSTRSHVSPVSRSVAHVKLAHELTAHVNAVVVLQE